MMRDRDLTTSMRPMLTRAGIESGVAASVGGLLVRREADSATHETIVRLDDVHLEYGEGASAVAALRGVSLAVERGELLAVTGPSGSGKTSLLNVIAGLQRPQSGSVRVGEIDVASASPRDLARMRRRSVAYVFQFFNLLPQLNARENTGIVLEADGVRARDVARRVEQALDAVGMRPRAEHLPSELSGGEMQRVAIARALACDAQILLADEPTGNLDSKTGADMLALLRDLVDREQRTIVLVTHDPKAAACGDRVIRMVDGRVVDGATYPAPPSADEHSPTCTP
jgi:putative ABC transport system ATP-binding protein